MYQQTSWIEISKEAFLHNVRIHKMLFNNAIFAPVIKNNAYGHDLNIIGQLCQESTDVDWLCVNSISEALTLRRYNITKPLLVLSCHDASLQEASNNQIDITIYDNQQLLWLQHISKTFQRPLHVHIKVDTGLSRLGWNIDQVIHIIAGLQQLPNVVIKGILTHLVDRDNAHITHMQLMSFSKLIKSLEQQKIFIPFKHISGMPSLAHNTYGCNFFRVGLGCYGITYCQESLALDLQLAMQWKAPIIHIKEIPTGTYIGYGHTHKTIKKTRIGIIPVGYADGYPITLSNQAQIVINGQKAPVIGRISMNLTIIDLTNCKATLGDHTIIIGNDKQIRPECLAMQTGSIPYQIITQLNPTIPRFLV